MNIVSPVESSPLPTNNHTPRYPLPLQLRQSGMAKDKGGNDTGKPQWQSEFDKAEAEKDRKAQEYLKKQNEHDAALTAQHNQRIALIGDRQVNAGPTERLVEEADKQRVRDTAKLGGKSPAIEPEKKDEKEKEKPTKLELVPPEFAKGPTVITPGLGSSTSRPQRRSILDEVQKENAGRTPEQIALEQQQQRQRDEAAQQLDQSRTRSLVTNHSGGREEL